MGHYLKWLTGECICRKIDKFRNILEIGSPGFYDGFDICAFVSIYACELQKKKTETQIAPNFLA